MRQRVLYTILVLTFLLPPLFTACSPTAAEVKSTNVPTTTPTIIASATLSPTPSITATVTQTTTPTITPTKTAIPEDVRNNLIENYGTVVFVQMSLGLLQETADRVKSGELTGFESFGAIIALATLVNSIDETIPSITPYGVFSIYWDDILSVHESVKDILRRWFNKEINSSVVLVEVEPIVSQMEQIVTEIETELADQYGVSVEEIQAERQKMLDSIDEIFDSPLATATP